MLQQLTQRQDQPQGIIYIPLLVWSDMADELAKAAGVDRTQLLYEDTRGLVADVDLGAEGSGSGALRGGSNDQD